MLRPTPRHNRRLLGRCLALALLCEWCARALTTMASRVSSPAFSRASCKPDIESKKSADTHSRGPVALCRASTAWMSSVPDTLP